MTAPRDWDEVARLVVEAQGGGADAFRELLVSHRSAVSSTLIACGVRSEDTARDLAQEVALRAWRRLATLQDPRSFTAWIRRIAANAARDHLRRMAVRREEELEQALELAGDDDPHAEAERRSELRLMLAALEDEDEEVVALLVARADGTPVEALALRAGLSEAALKMRLMRARKRLRERLEELRRS
ncbi:MAG TPA: sigma-70 family RNA polymerase sigma factor [Thermoanaerobaculales bacterium]|nr:sigma-70 family RNA polymerase sigma factor [Thermoanaerobaculales bacterium]HPA80767.1 sigma-70 family RNA polymerase sigma factor [Thermoanaerobaculales bacterium]HQL29861.1 sigma-70 family RNA polymerase sigma factor [Thermoanaerobaculales bacterium]HQN96785.1 sigma-70 family RNA polymerase sigma factor [Thermoanaerobaculales bacterium]